MNVDITQYAAAGNHIDNDTHAADPQNGRSGGRDDNKDTVGRDPAVKKQTQKRAAHAPAESIPPAEMITLIFAHLQEKGIAGHHLESINSFLQNGIKQITTGGMVAENRFRNERDSTDHDKAIAEISYRVTFNDVHLTKPQTPAYHSGKLQINTPALSRMNGITYFSYIYADIEVETVAYMRDGTEKRRSALVKELKTASFPCPVRSVLCHTYGKTTEELKAMGEDPKDRGGYYIIRGHEWIVNNLENVSINEFNVFKNAYKDEIARGTIISKPGDGYENSFQIIIRYLQSGAITLEITTGKFDSLHFPFYIVFRILGITSDREIADHIVYGVDNTDVVTLELLRILNKAFAVEDAAFSAVKNSIDRDEIIRHAVRRANTGVNFTSADNDDNATKHLNTQFLSMFDAMFFPHVGTDSSARIKKLRYLGHLINNLLTVALGITEQTDRDNYGTKRITPAGSSLAKVFKTVFNQAIIKKSLKKSLNKAFKENAFSSVNLEETVRSCIRPDVLEKMFVQSIVAAGSSSIKKNEPATRLSTQQLVRKNDLYMFSALRTIDTPNTTASKQNERADEMRRVHPSLIGFVDPSQSADTGEKVGMTKQMAIMAIICLAASSFTLKAMLLSDDLVIPLEKVEPAQIVAEKLAKIMVHGDWIGCCADAHKLRDKYRAMRTEGKINHVISIICEPTARVIRFVTDANRMLRPLVIVRNNIEEYIAERHAGRQPEFKQWHSLTQKHIHGLKTGELAMNDLMLEGVIEYISPAEQENMLLATNMQVFDDHANDITRQYTHIDIDQAIFGIITTSAPMPQCSNATRVTYFTNHKKQATTWYALNYPYRVDKNVAMQWNCSRPLISTFTDALISPSGLNPIVLLCPHDGCAMEDSLTINQASVDCGLYNGSFYYYESADLKKGEEFGKPDEATTLDIKNATYEFIEADAVAVGTRIKKGTVIIPKKVKLDQPIDGRTHVDRSIVYNRDEPAVVERVINARNDTDERVVKVKLRFERHIAVGDKMSSRTGNKGIIAANRPRNKMPYCDDGTIADLVVDQHSIPTRMAINQVLECLLGSLAARAMVHIDASPMVVISWDDVFARLEELGVPNLGHRRWYNPETGEPIDTLCFGGPTTYQRIQKFINDENYAIKSGPKSQMTKQPVDGKNNEGGLRIGEMEKDCFMSHQVMGAFAEKIHDHSDGTDIYICKCGLRAVANERENLYYCKRCGGSADIRAVKSSHCANLFMHEVEGMGINLEFETEPDIIPMNE